MGFYKIDIKTKSTLKDGALAFFEAGCDIQFDIKRIYYIFGAKKGVYRGGHAHKSLSQILFCPYGSVLLKLEDEKGRKQEIILDNPSEGVVIERCTWREMIWQRDDSVLCVAASDYYKEDDYIRDYNDFLIYIKEK